MSNHKCGCQNQDAFPSKHDRGPSQRQDRDHGTSSPPSKHDRGNHVHVCPNCRNPQPENLCPDGIDEILVANIAALAALPVATCPDQFPDGVKARPLTIDQDFELARSDTRLPDGITIVAAAGGGNWLRILSHVPKWTAQINWSVDPVTGNDENSGTDGSPLKTVAEAMRRIFVAQVGKNYQISLLNDSLQTDRFRPSAIQDQNDEDVVPATAQPTPGGAEQTFNFTLKGVDPLLRTSIATGVVGPGGLTPQTAGPTGGAQPTLDLGNAALPGANIGKLIVLTSGPSTGATAGIGFDAGGGIAKVSEFRTPYNSATASGNVIVTTIAPGTTFRIVSPTKWNGPFIQIGNSQGRYRVQDLAFPAAPTAPFEQNLIALRYASVTFSRCIFQRPTDWSSFSAVTCEGCIFDYTGQKGIGVGKTVLIDCYNSFAAFTACLILNADLRMVQNAVVNFTNTYMQGSRATTRNSSEFTTYGYFPVAGGTNHADVTVIDAGLGIFDWPVVSNSLDAGFTLTGESRLIISNGADLYGNNVNPNGYGVRLNGGSKFLWQTAGATQPSITGSVPVIQGDVQMEAITSFLQPFEDTGSLGPYVPGPLPAQAPLTRWSDWAAPVVPGTGAPGTAFGFGRHVMSYRTGAMIAQIAR